MHEFDQPPQGLHLMAKPVGPLCNLDCSYCFYLAYDQDKGNPLSQEDRLDAPLGISDDWQCYPTRKNSTLCPALTARHSQAGISPCPSQVNPSPLRVADRRRFG